MALTARSVFEAALTELSKVNAPSLLLHEFNYYINKAIRQYTNKRYNIYDINLLTTDDLRVLKATAKLTPLPINSEGVAGKIFDATYEVILPDDYLHMLNCVCIYKMAKNHRCYDTNELVAFSAKKLTADSWSLILNDYYNRPLPERPYYYIHNVNLEENLPTNKFSLTIPGSTDLVWTGTEEGPGYTEKVSYPRTISLGGSETTVISDVPGSRYANASKVRCEIRYGSDRSIYLLKEVHIDYLKAPQIIRLTLTLINLTEDTSLIMEFPDYVCQEIINELVILVMQRDADPRLQTLSAVTLSIANPVQQLTPLPLQLRS